MIISGRDVTVLVAGHACVPVSGSRVHISGFFREVLREHEDGNGFTLTTKDARSAFSMAERMAFSGKKYSIKVGKEPGQDWVVVVTEVQS